MFGTWIDKVRHFVDGLWKAGRRRRARRLAETAAMEKRARKALVEDLIKKFAAAQARCEANDKSVAAIELSLKEITFIEWHLNTWSRELKESEIFELSPEQ